MSRIRICINLPKETGSGGGATKQPKIIRIISNTILRADGNFLHIF